MQARVKQREEKAKEEEAKLERLKVEREEQAIKEARGEGRSAGCAGATATGGSGSQ